MSHQEDLQILRYGIGQKYGAHMDVLEVLIIFCVCVWEGGCVCEWCENVYGQQCMHTT